MEKFTMYFKTPDVLEQLNDEDQEEFAKKFVEYGENITVEFDPSTNSAKLLLK